MWRWLSPSVARNDGCPVDHKSMSSDEVAAYMAKHNAGPAASVEAANDAAHGGASGTNTDSGCPVDHENMTKEEIAAFMAQHRHANARGQGKKAQAVEGAEEEKAKEKDAGGREGKKAVYDVYGQEIDPTNMMPAVPNQLPSPGQEVRLSTEREASSIPKAGAGERETWTYPSPQMFYNSLKRKGKADDVKESDMDSVVAIHNNMNEQTWGEVMDWERRFHCGECANPKLKRFQGRPHDLSPAARFRSTFRGYPVPFDRHDWVVDRCGKEDVRYVIDYYYRETPDGEPIELHVRPALDSAGAAWDRARNALGLLQGARTPSPASGNPSVGPEASRAVGETSPAEGAPRSVSDAPISDEEFKFLRDLTPERVDEISKEVKRDCGAIGIAAAHARGDSAAYEQATVALNYCMATKICKSQANNFIKALEDAPGSEAESYVEMTSCLERFHVMAKRVMLQASGIPQSGPEQ